MTVFECGKRCRSDLKVAALIAYLVGHVKLAPVGTCLAGKYLGTLLALLLVEQIGDTVYRLNAQVRDAALFAAERIGQQLQIVAADGGCQVVVGTVGIGSPDVVVVAAADGHDAILTVGNIAVDVDVGVKLILLAHREVVARFPQHLLQPAGVIESQSDAEGLPLGKVAHQTSVDIEGESLVLVTE